MMTPRDQSLELEWLPGRYAVCRLEATDTVPEWAEHAQSLCSVTRSEEELSIVALEHAVPQQVKCERGWAALRVVGPLDFALVGILAQLTNALAEANVPVFALSTYDTDYLLVKAEHAARAREALRRVAPIRGELSNSDPDCFTTESH